MRIVATIEARMRSTRLPGKVLKPILGRPMLELMIERLGRVQQVDDVVIATSDDPSCDPIEELAVQLGVSCFRGSEEDVLDRVLKAGRQAQADVIVETTGDCPLIDPNVVDGIISIYLANGFDYVSTLQRTFPLGMDTQVFATAVLEEVARLTQDPVDREHVSLYIYEHPDRFSVHWVPSKLPEEYWGLRLVVDTPEDFALMSAIYENLYPKNRMFSLQDVLDLFSRQPELREINQHIKQRPV